jgi:hypothetical protein
VVGVVVLVVALAAAVVKPWESGGPGAAGVGPSFAAVAATAPASGGTVPLASSTRPRASLAPTVPAQPPPTWADFGAIANHDALGVMAILVGQGAYLGQPAPPRYAERWGPWTPGAADGEFAVVQSDDKAIVALGVTVPSGQVPQDLRIWHARGDGGLEWVDAHAIAGGPKDGALLFARPGVAGSAFTSWAAGRYRIDLLVDGAVERIAIVIPDRFGNDPVPADPPQAILAGLVKPTASDPSSVPFGLFATVDGTGVPLSAAAGGSLGEAAAWLDVLSGPRRSSPFVVSEAYLPRATGLGVMLTSHAAISAATVERLAPDAGLPAQEMLGGVSYLHGGTPWVVFAGPSGGVWPAGVYALTVSWSDTTGAHSSTWHVELRPGPLGATS